MRADLLALTPDALAALTNRGLVKRATREVEAAPPAVTEDPDGTVRGVYPDGPETALPPGGLERGGCTCGATGTCRHVVGLVLAYQTQPQTETPSWTQPAEVVGWSPGRFTDEQLEARIGVRQLSAARRAHKGGYVARVHRPTVADPAPRVELGSATVRFLVPDDLGFVHTDAVAGARDDVLALAVWAFRVADAVAPESQDVQVDVGGPDKDDGGDESLEAALRLADEVLLTGATQVGPGIAGRVAEVRQRLDRAGLRWPLLAVGDLEEQLGAYGQRAGSYSHERLAGLVAELHARHRAVTNRGASLRARVLGTQEAAETPMRRARLDGLGCRVRAVGARENGDPGDPGDATSVEIYFVHADSATVLVMRRTFADGQGIGARRIGGATVAQLAGGNVVTESAIRSASRTVRLATSRIAKTTVTPSQGLWTALPEALVVRDLRALAADLDRLPPRVVRPRVEAELVRVVQIAEVRSVRYAPGAQRLDAVVADPAGGLATITATHTAAAPGALDAIAAALSGPVRAVAGTVARTRGELVIEPLGLAVGDQNAGDHGAGDQNAGDHGVGDQNAGDHGVGDQSAGDQNAGDHGVGDHGVVVPDLAPPGGFRIDGGVVVDGDPLRHAVDMAVALLAEVPHRGLRMLPPTFGDRLRDAAETLARVGLHRSAAALGALRSGLGPDPGAAAAELWVDAYLRLLVTLELQ